MMKSFNEFLNEEAGTEQELIAGIEAAFNKQFPNGYINVGMRKGLGSPYVSLNIGLIKDQSHLSSNIRDNDPMFHTFMISPTGPDGFTAEALRSGLKTNPEPGSHYAMGTVKTNFRKSKGNAAKLIKTFTTFFKRLHAIVDEHGNNVYQRSEYDDKYFK